MMWTFILAFSVWAGWEFWHQNWVDGGFATLAVVIVLIMHLVGSRPMAKRAALKKRLEKNGRRVTGQITEAHQTNTFINGLPVMRYTVDYPFEGTPYTGKLRMPVPHAVIGSMGRNAKVAVLVNPKKPKEFVIRL